MTTQDARHTNASQNSSSHAVAGSGARGRSRRRAGLGTVACAVLTLAAAAPGASAAGWQDTVKNVTAPGQHGEAPQVAVSAVGFGKAAAVWSADGQIRAALRPTMSFPWLQSGNISGPSTGARYPQIAVDGQNNRIAIWSEYEEPYSVLYSAVRPAGGVWQAPVMLSLPGTYADDPHLVMNANGDAVAAWGLHDDGVGNTMQAAVRPAGGIWQAPSTIGPRHSPVVGPDVAINAQGDIAVVWVNRGTPWRVEATMRPAGGSWQRPVDISVASDLLPWRPDVAVDAQGNALVAWDGYDPVTGEKAVRSAERPSGGSWKPAVDIDARKLGTVLSPQVAFDGTGRALAVWTRKNVGLPLVVQSAERPAGGAWTKPFEISSHKVSAGSPRLAVNTKGDAVAVWPSRNDLWGGGTPDDAQGAVRPAGATWQAPVTLSPAGAKADEPQVGIDASGDAVAVWSHTTNAIVQSRSYAAG